jgi:predicted O-methyltransferase YrrM
MFLELKDDGTRIPPDSEFGRAVYRVIEQRRPRRILETGTFIGTGSTRIIVDAVRELGIESEFVSIEVNPDCHQMAVLNLRGEHVRLACGLSIPRSLLPARRQIQRESVEYLDPAALHVDHDIETRASEYEAETAWPHACDDLIGQEMEAWKGQCDMVLLDSAGHIGTVEFLHLLSVWKSGGILVLDDTEHLKHCRSLRIIKSDPRFEIIEAGHERFGFAIAIYRPGGLRS